MISQKSYTAITYILLSGLAWYISNGLDGDYWWLLWVAPVPVLFMAFQTSWKQAFVISFIAYLIGRLSWISYLINVATLVPAIISILALCVVLALIVLGSRYVFLNKKSWLAVFAYPVFFTVFEYLLMLFSKDGSAASIAYSQSDFLPLVQMVSVTGILGITFFISFIPSAITLAYLYWNEQKQLKPLVITSILFVGLVLTFGVVRLKDSSNNNNVKVAMAVLDENMHDMSAHPDFSKSMTAAKFYGQDITMLAMHGAKLVVLPERAVNMDKESAGFITNILQSVARENHVYIVAGYTNMKNVNDRNSSLVIDDAGNVLKDYNKVHLVTGLENRFTPGDTAGLFSFNNIQAGTAICKDLDFPRYMQQYGKSNVQFLCVPAWDFVTDDWLHSRMAILRGVENGFAEVRAARQGRLTISDAYGRVSAEENTSTGNRATLDGFVSTEKHNTIYSKYGDWFGILNIIAAVTLLFFLKRNKD
jgi:apolipoprotein N-acyltransferase